MTCSVPLRSWKKNSSWPAKKFGHMWHRECVVSVGHAIEKGSCCKGSMLYVLCGFCLRAFTGACNI